MPVALTNSTAQKLRDLLQSGPPAGGGAARGGVGGPRVTWVLVQGDVGYGYYECVPCSWMGELEEWEEYEPALVRNPNPGPLPVGQRVFTFSGGTYGGIDVYLAILGVAAPAKRPLATACLVFDDYGRPVDIAQQWVQEDGSVACEFGGACPCSPEDVPVDPDPDPDPEPETCTRIWGDVKYGGGDPVTFPLLLLVGEPGLIAGDGGGNYEQYTDLHAGGGSATVGLTLYNPHAAPPVEYIAFFSTDGGTNWISAGASTSSWTMTVDLPSGCGYDRQIKWRLDSPGESSSSSSSWSSSSSSSSSSPPPSSSSSSVGPPPSSSSSGVSMSSLSETSSAVGVEMWNPHEWRFGPYFPAAVQPKED